ncbi:hypothetical protein DMH25_18705 [Streptomyces sp. WAC 01325]|nr:hypothetical protein DMH25_18705 [Streptomyces sp. WAC 01325]
MGPVVGRYELLGGFSHGGMGDVWRGCDAVLDRPVAVKVIRDKALASPQLVEELAKGFKREARITAWIHSRPSRGGACFPAPRGSTSPGLSAAWRSPSWPTRPSLSDGSATAAGARSAPTRQ